MKKGERDDRKKICRWLAEWDARNMVMKKLDGIEKKTEAIEVRVGTIEKEEQRRKDAVGGEEVDEMILLRAIRDEIKCQGKAIGDEIRSNAKKGERWQSVSLLATTGTALAIGGIGYGIGVGALGFNVWVPMSAGGFFLVFLAWLLSNRKQ